MKMLLLLFYIWSVTVALKGLIKGRQDDLNIEETATKQEKPVETMKVAYHIFVTILFLAYFATYVVTVNVLSAFPIVTLFAVLVIMLDVSAMVQAMKEINKGILKWHRRLFSRLVDISFGGYVIYLLVLTIMAGR